MSKWHLLSEELIAEILTRLPAKPLARSKLVSKHWNSIISYPHFLKSYISRSTPSSSSSWVILDRNPQLEDDSTHYVTQFNLVYPPNVSTSSMNTYKLANEPFLDPDDPKYPTVLLHSSNGFLLFTLFVEREKTHCPCEYVEESLFVVNPVTNECAPLPPPQNSIVKELTHVAFTTKPDPETGLVDKFMVVEYQPVSLTHANLLCFSSDVGKWFDKSANYMLGSRPWRPEGSFEFKGKLFWIDLSIGLITWDLVGDDPFVGLEGEDAAVCRFIPLPSGRAKPVYTNTLLGKRYVGCDGGFIQYIEVFKKESGVFKLWRLNDCRLSGEWNFMYKVSRDYLEKNLPCGFEKGMPKPCFIHPFDADVAYFKTSDYVFSLNVRTQEVGSCVGFDGSKYILSMVLPKWPSPIPKRLWEPRQEIKKKGKRKRQSLVESVG